MTRAGALLVPDEVLPQEDAQLVLDPRSFPTGPLKALAAEGALTMVGLDMTKGDEYTYREYEKLGGYLGVMRRACDWWLGDWLLYGEQRYGEKFSQAVLATGLSEKTIQNKMYISNAIPMALRRVNLSFSVHAVVAGCQTAREMKHWLDQAEKHGWTVEQLREAMRKRRHETAPPLLPADGNGGGDLVEIRDAAEAVAAARKDYGADWLVPREPMARLLGALGQE